MNEYVIRKKEALITRYEKSTATVGGTDREIYETIEALCRNTFQSMYRTIIEGRCCEVCTRTTNLQRCHGRRTRIDIAMEAIRTTECIGPNGLRYRHLIMIKFVALHEHEPIKIMCPPCHSAHDNPPLRLKLEIGQGTVVVYIIRRRLKIP